MSVTATVERCGVIEIYQVKDATDERKCYSMKRFHFSINKPKNQKNKCI